MNHPVCIVTGGTGGIGAQLCTGFAAAGYTVAAFDLCRLNPLPDHVLYLQVDLANAEAINTAFTAVTAQCGQPHVLINNAAVAHFHQPLSRLATTELDRVMAINLRAPVLCAQAFARANAGQPYGRIINIASTRWNQNEADWEVYGATKGGLVALTRSLAVSLGGTHVTVNAVSPGWIHTNDTPLRPEDHAQHPSGRVGHAGDVLNACLFLANEDNAFVNGHNMVVDGGMSCKMQYID